MRVRNPARRDRISDADVAVTGEGRYDATSLEGKVVGGVAELAAQSGTRVLAVVGSCDPAVQVPESVEVVDLTARFGSQRAHADPCGCVREALEDALRGGL